ncbi:MAG: Gfo/Idh/MocA family oxidoreductase [Candidatus Aminicenantales bacterium]
MKNFALIGAAGYIAPRHLKAIKDTGNCLVAAVDKSDSVGILDGYFPGADFFTEFERFDRHIEKLRRMGSDRSVHYVSITSPNYLHDAHIRFALRVGADAICEKPLVLNPWNIDALKEIESESGKKIYSILQLRLHPAIIALKKRIAENPISRKYDIDLTYITGRGKWYQYSWKGDENKSGGIATNIGVHFFDMLVWIFGAPAENIVHFKSPTRAAGFLDLEKARVRWFLSLDMNDLPAAIVSVDQRTYRCLTIDDEPLEFSQGFADLHTRSYEEILAGRGFGLEENRPAVEIVHRIRHVEPDLSRGARHPLIGAL